MGLHDRSGNVKVRFTRRADDAPVFARTENCDVRYSSQVAESSTGEPLERALRSFVEAATGNDEICLGLVRTVDEGEPPDEGEWGDLPF